MDVKGMQIGKVTWREIGGDSLKCSKNKSID